MNKHKLTEKYNPKEFEEKLYKQCINQIISG